MTPPKLDPATLRWVAATLRARANFAGSVASSRRSSTRCSAPLVPHERSRWFVGWMAIRPSAERSKAGE
jgi:hypothetical protein